MAGLQSVEESLKKVIEYFVVTFETYVSEYHRRLVDGIPKTGKTANFMIELLTVLKGSTEALETWSKALALISVELILKGIRFAGEATNEEKLRKLEDRLEQLNKDSSWMRGILIDSAAEIFHCYESQFIKMSAENGKWETAVEKVVHDAVTRVFDYMRKKVGKETSQSMITKGVIRGKSKKYKLTNLHKGHHVWIEGVKIDTQDLFENTGLKVGGEYYQKNNCNLMNLSKFWTNTAQNGCGYRELFCWEINKKAYEDQRAYTKITSVASSNANQGLTDDTLNRIKDEMKKIDNMAKGVELKYIRQSAGEQAEKDVKLVADKVDEIKIYLETLGIVIGRIDTTTQAIHKDTQDIKNDVKIIKENICRPPTDEQNRIDDEPIKFDLISPVKLFTGRKRELKELHESVQRNSHTYTSICGFGGIGKTELVREYIRKHKELYRNFIWINAESKTSLTESFGRVAVELKIRRHNPKNVGTIVSEVYTVLNRVKCLLIFDNVENYDDLKIFLPPECSKPGTEQLYVLFTSHIKEKRADVEVMELKHFDPDDAITFVQEGIGINDRKRVEKLAKTLQYYPLALQVAVAYINDLSLSTNKGLAIDEYLNLYERDPQKWLSAAPQSITGYNKTILTIWNMTKCKIAEQETHGELALNILNVVAFLAPENIHLEYFFCLEPHRKDQLKEAVQSLDKYSMINVQRDQSVLSIHRLLQQVTITQIEEADKPDVFRNTLKLLENNFTGSESTVELNSSVKLTKKMTLVPHLQKFLFHVIEWSLKRPEDKLIIEEYFSKLTTWITELSTQFWTIKQILDLNFEDLEKRAINRAGSFDDSHITLVELGRAYLKLGEYKRAEAVLEKARQAFEKHYGAESIEVAKILLYLGVARVRMIDSNYGEELFQKSLAINIEENRHEGQPVSRDPVDKHYLQIVEALESLGRAYIHLNDGRPAVESLERALSFGENYLGKEHPIVARVVDDLSTAHAVLGNTRLQQEFQERTAERSVDLGLSLAFLDMFGDLLEDGKNQ